MFTKSKPRKYRKIKHFIYGCGWEEECCCGISLNAGTLNHDLLSSQLYM
jgi:hypothetical protein